VTDDSSLSQLQTISIALQGLAAGIILVLLSAISFQISGFTFGLSFIPIIALMYWPKKASKSWSMIFVFFLGLVQATISFSPLGLWALCYLSLFIILGGEIVFSERLSTAWGSFFVCVLFVVIILYFVGRLMLGQWPPLTPMVTDLIASVLIFPLVFWGRNLASTFGRESEKREIS
jgi:hypothetical protein